MLIPDKLAIAHISKSRNWGKKSLLIIFLSDRKASFYGFFTEQEGRKSFAAEIAAHPHVFLDITRGSTSREVFNSRPHLVYPLVVRHLPAIAA